MTVDRAAAVAGRGALRAEALDGALIAVALARAGHVDVIAGREGVRLHDVADVELIAVFQTELFQVLLGLDARLGEVALFRLGELLGGSVLKTELNGGIAFLLDGLLLHDHAGACLDDGHGNDLARLIEDLRHADLLADDGFLH